MARKTLAPTLEQIQEALLAHSFRVTPAPAQAGGLWVEKYGCAAVLVRGTGANAAPGVDPGADTVVAFRERPGAVVAGEIARLVDRGYQKFQKTTRYELPATAAQLEAVHRFTEELTQVTGGISLYNEALGTTSDEYLYDRLRGREPAPHSAARPWDAAGSTSDCH
jgi:hypothetical protein